MPDSRELKQRIAELERELDEAKEDTADIDWLADRKYLCFGTNYHDGQWCVQIETEGYAERGPSLRGAIRAARKERG